MKSTKSILLITLLAASATVANAQPDEREAEATLNDLSEGMEVTSDPANAATASHTWLTGGVALGVFTYLPSVLYGLDIEASRALSPQVEALVSARSASTLGDFSLGGVYLPASRQARLTAGVRMHGQGHLYPRLGWELGVSGVEERWFGSDVNGKTRAVGLELDVTPGACYQRETWRACADPGLEFAPLMMEVADTTGQDPDGPATRSDRANAGATMVVSMGHRW